MLDLQLLLECCLSRWNVAFSRWSCCARSSAAVAFSLWFLELLLECCLFLLECSLFSLELLCSIFCLPGSPFCFSMDSPVHLSFPFSWSCQHGILASFALTQALLPPSRGAALCTESQYDKCLPRLNPQLAKMETEI